MRFLRRFKKGQGTTEYIILLAVLVVVAYFVVSYVGGKLQSAGQRAGDKVEQFTQ